MGFMKFGKKDKTNQLDSLDIPPPPPMDNSKGMPMPPQFNDNMQGMPPMPPQYNEMPPMPPMPGPAGNAGFGMPKSKDNVLPPMQPMPPGLDIPPMSGDIPMPKMDDMPYQQSNTKMPNKSFDDLFKSQEKPSEPRFASREPSAAFASGKPVFIAVSKYREILRDLGEIKESLKQTDEEINSLIGDIDAEEKVFMSLHKTLSDVEQKLTKLEDGLFS